MAPRSLFNDTAVLLKGVHDRFLQVLIAVENQVFVSISRAVEERRQLHFMGQRCGSSMLMLRQAKDADAEGVRNAGEVVSEGAVVLDDAAAFGGGMEEV